MRNGHQFGATSLWLGALSLVAAVVVFEIDRYSIFDPTAHPVVLNVLDHLGVVRAPDKSRQMMLTPAYITSVNDANAVGFLRLHVWWLAAWAIGIAIWAEFKKESTLYLSAGFIFGYLALLLLNPLIGMAALAVGAVAVVLLRQRWVSGHR